MNGLAQQVLQAFKERFIGEPLVIYSPGRINFIGEHIDYNDGYVMPAAIDKGIFYAVAPNGTDTLNFYSTGFDEELSISIEAVKKMDGWKNYVLSVVNEFKLLKADIRGFDCVFGGDIATGAGISSSAAVEGGLAYALNELFNTGLDRKQLALLCQSAEHNYPGVMCGIMDQYANMFGKKDHVILLDCLSVEHTYFPLELKGYTVVLINCNVHHSLASSEYNVRREQCKEGLDIMKKELGIHSFRDIKDPGELDFIKDKLGADIYKRCLYVVQEILRTQRAGQLLKDKQIEAFGKLMFETHEGLSKLYNVSCPELDFLVEEARKDPNVIGSRLMGGGFGGCTINIVKTDGVHPFIAQVKENYVKAFNIKAEEYLVAIEDGTHQL